jgi:hypothetical protein
MQFDICWKVRALFHYCCYLLQCEYERQTQPEESNSTVWQDARTIKGESVALKELKQSVMGYAFV